MAEDVFYAKVDPVIDCDVIRLCLKAYPAHKKGCPNFNKKEGCPPKTKSINKLIDLSQSVYAIYNIFDFKGHVEKMKAAHPNWSERQLKCVLYWQPKARKQLKEKIKLFFKEFPELTIVPSPEANSVNITETMKNSGILLEWPPENITYQIVFAGTSIKVKNNKI